MNAKPRIEIQIAGASFYDEVFAPWAGEWVEDFDADAIEAEYNAQLEALAPEDVSWGWTTRPYIFATWDADRDALREAFSAAIASAEEGGIDLESIAMRHEINRDHITPTETN